MAISPKKPHRFFLFLRRLGIVAAVLLAVFAALLLFWGNYRRSCCEGACPAWLTEGPIAHRGLHGDADIDENSLSAFRLAAEAGYAIELDLRYTKDKVPMVLHDYKMGRLFGIDKQLLSLTYDEAKDLRYLNSGEPLPTLEEALALVDGQVPLMLELKEFRLPGEFEANVVELIRNYKGPFVVVSYSPFALNSIKQLAPEIPVGLLLDDIPGLPAWRPARILKDNLCCALCRPAFLVYNCAILEDGELDQLRADGIPVLGFLYSEADLASGAYLSKVDNILFAEEPDD